MTLLAIIAMITGAGLTITGHVPTGKSRSLGVFVFCLGLVLALR